MHRSLILRLKACTTASITALITTVFLTFSIAQSDEAQIIDAKIKAASGENMFRIDVTIKHADEGWDHYANQWDILDSKGKLLGSRVLHHPHENEQPFTRSLSLKIPAHVTTLTIVAHDSVHKDNPVTMELAVPGRS